MSVHDQPDWKPSENDICPDCLHSLAIDHVFYCSETNCHCDYLPVEHALLLADENANLRAQLAQAQERVGELEKAHAQTSAVLADRERQIARMEARDHAADVDGRISSLWKTIAQRDAEIARLRESMCHLVTAASAVVLANRQLCVSHPQFAWKCTDHLDAAIKAADSKGESS